MMHTPGAARDIETLEKFHREVFRKEPTKAGIMWSALRDNPAEALQSLFQMIEQPHNQTFELGFLLGSVMAFSLNHDPIRAIGVVESTISATKALHNVKHS